MAGVFPWAVEVVVVVTSPSVTSVQFSGRTKIANDHRIERNVQLGRFQSA